jgi:deoxyribose-phosphate aldolase
MALYPPVVAGVPTLSLTDWRSAAKLIEHTLLRADATRSQVTSLCREAARYEFHSVMVNPSYVGLAVAELRGTPLKVGTVIGFPLGANMTSTKIAEAETALRQGAHELDMVMNIGALKSGDRAFVKAEIRTLADLAHRHGAILKLILENALLSQEEKILACALAVDAGVDFVKTSSGVSHSGASAQDVALMRGVVGWKIGVKAAGGIRTAAQLAEMVDAGANRIGTSAGVEIMREMGAG